MYSRLCMTPCDYPARAQAPQLKAIHKDVSRSCTDIRGEVTCIDGKWHFFAKIKNVKGRSRIVIDQFTARKSTRTEIPIMENTTMGMMNERFRVVFFFQCVVWVVTVAVFLCFQFVLGIGLMQFAVIMARPCAHVDRNNTYVRALLQCIGYCCVLVCVREVYMASPMIRYSEAVWSRCCPVCFKL